MSKDKKQRYLYIDDQAVPVTEEVYRAYWRYTAKEDYFTRKLKTERFSADQDTQTAAFTPSREDSYERLLEQDRQFACDGKPVEEQAVSSLWMEEVLAILEETERTIICGLFYQERTERELWMELQMTQNTVNYWKVKALKKNPQIFRRKFLNLSIKTALPLLK